MTSEILGGFAVAALFSTQAPSPGFAGWGPLSIGMDRVAAETALTEGKIPFETKTLHKDGKQLLEFTRGDGWKAAVYFDEKGHVAQVGFTSPQLSAADAKAFLAACEKSLGAPARAYDRPEERRGEKVWKSDKAALGVSWSFDDSNKWTVFETYHEAGY